MTDDVLQGVRAAREAFARSHGYDVYAMVAALGRQNAAGDWPVVSFPPRAPQPSRLNAIQPNVSESAVSETGVSSPLCKAS